MKPSMHSMFKLNQTAKPFTPSSGIVNPESPDYFTSRTDSVPTPKDIRPAPGRHSLQFLIIPGFLEPVKHELPLPQTYSKYFYENNFHKGPGKIVQADGRVFVGNFVDGVMKDSVFQGSLYYENDRAIFTRENGDCIVGGTFVNGYLNGQVMIKVHDGRIIHGFFIDDKLADEAGKILLTSGEIYVGKFKDGVMQNPRCEAYYSAGKRFANNEEYTDKHLERLSPSLFCYSFS